MYKLIALIILAISAIGCSEEFVIRNRDNSKSCLVYGQIHYSIPNLVEEGLRELVIINVKTKATHEARVVPYEFGYIIENIPTGQYAIKNAKWIFIDAASVASLGIVRQIAIELKFSPLSYNHTIFNIKKGGVFFAGSHKITYKNNYLINKVITNKYFPFLDKIKDKIKFSNWIKPFKTHISTQFKIHKAFGLDFLRSKFPQEVNTPYNLLIKKYLEG